MGNKASYSQLQEKLTASNAEVSELKEQLAATKQELEKHRRLFEKETDAVMIFDAATYAVEEVNEALSALTGFSTDELLSFSAIDLLADKEKMAETIQTALKRDVRPNKIVFARFLAQGGESFPCAIYANQFDWFDRKKIFWEVRDITENLKTREKLRKSREALFQAQKMEALGTLVAGVAHEINNPINLIIYNLPLIRRMFQDFKPILDQHANDQPGQKFGGLPYAFIQENLDQMISDMDLGAHRIEDIVGRLKEFVRKTRGLEKSEISVNEALNNALRLAGSTLKKSNVELRCDLKEDMPKIFGHLQSIEQVVLNLIINAIESIDHDRGFITVQTDYEKAEDRVLISVQDNGEGMPDEIREKIFDPFFTEKQASGGTGLGLSVSYSLIKEHNGELTCTSAPGQGTTFTIRLPVQAEQKPVKVLIADDDEAFRNLLDQALMKAGKYSIEKVGNGTEAMIKMGAYRPDILILDLFMPEMNGLNVCQTIVREPSLSEMKVLIVTGNPESPEISDLKKIGFHRIFIKPIDIKEFVQAVAEIENIRSGEPS
jgi:PAS domain S-box-containing protein